MSSLPTTAASSTSGADDLCRAILLECAEGEVVLGLPSTSYRIRLRTTAPREALEPRIGKRILGRVRGRALRMFPARGGGRFIEPIDGHPRIVNATILEIDHNERHVLADMVIPVRLAVVAKDQCFEEIRPGQLVNMYVESGMLFEPVL